MPFNQISSEIIEAAGAVSDGFIEIERQGSTIVQLGSFRIVITRPPFSDGWEITAVRPVKKLNLDDYKLSEKLTNRIAKQAEGMLIAGPPGAGKSTFAQALAEYYAGQNKIVKTVEAPRDLQLSDNITQYSITHGSPQEIHDILLLSRPDYTIFDEMRNTPDFALFSESQGRILVTINPKNKKEFEKIIKGNYFKEIGKITENQKIIIKGLNNKDIVNLNLEKIEKAYKSTFKNY